MKKNLFYSNDEVYSIIHKNLNAMTSPGSENAIIRPDEISVSPTSFPKNIRLHTHTIVKSQFLGLQLSRQILSVKI